MIQNNIPSFPTASDTIYEPSPVDGIRLIYIILMTGVLLERANSIIPGVVAAFRLQGISGGAGLAVEACAK